MNRSEAQRDLAIKHYPGKWRTAITMAGVRDKNYWGRVRLYYLELGGLFIGQLKPGQQALYFNGSFTA